jgi:hypothetical protein
VIQYYEYSLVNNVNENWYMIQYENRKPGCWDEKDSETGSVSKEVLLRTVSILAQVKWLVGSEMNILVCFSCWFI